MAVYKKVPGHETVNISTLEFDETPTPGSLNPVTSDGVAKAVGNVSEGLGKTETDLANLAELFFLNTKNIEVPSKKAKVGDGVYADADGKVHFVMGNSIVAASIPAGWEFVGSVSIRKGTKATIINKTENGLLKFAACWLFKVTGLTFPLTSPVSMVMQQGPASGSTPVEVGTYTSSEGVTTLDDFVADLDDWLQNNPTANGAFPSYGWHAAKMADANGDDACFIVVDNIDSQTRFSPVKSGDAIAPSYMWDFAGFTTDVSAIKRKDGVNTSTCIWNKERLKAYNSNVGSPTDSLTTTGVFNEAGFNATTIVKGYYGTYDNYLNYMVPDTEATTGAYAIFKGFGKQIADKLSAVKYTPINGTETSVFTAEAYAKSIKAHSTASVEGLNAGDWYIPGIDESYEILSKMKADGSDPVNACIVAAGGSAISISNGRWIPARNGYPTVWQEGGSGVYSTGFMPTNYRTCFVAEYDVGE